MTRQPHPILLRLLALIALVGGISLLFLFERGSSALRQAQAAEQQGNFKIAAQRYLQAARMFVWNRTALHIQAAQNAARGGEYTQVISLLAPLQQEQLLPYPAQLLLAQAYLASGQVEAVLSLRQQWVEAGESTTAIDPKLLEILTEEGRYEQTLPILRSLVAAQPKNAAWQYRLGLVLAAESPAQAGPPLQQAAQLDGSYQARVAVLLAQLSQAGSEPALAYLYSGRGLAAINEWALAERAFSRALALRPDFADAWAYLGLARFRLASAQDHPLPLQPTSLAKEQPSADLRQQDRPGLAELRFALQLNPRSQVAYAFLTLIWQELGESQLALHSAQEAFRLYPHDLTVRLQYAQALAQSGDLEGGWLVLNEALQSARQPLASRKSLVLYCIQYGYRLAESALPLAQDIVRQQPQDVESIDLLGQVYLALDNWTLAQQSFERALSLDEGYAPAWLHLGMLHFGQGHLQLARSFFQKALELEPYSASAEQAKRYLEVYLP